MTTNLAENIRKIRKERGLTQEQLEQILKMKTISVEQTNYIKNLLKENNPCGLHNAAIGHLMAYSDKKDHEAMNIVDQVKNRRLSNC